MKGAVRRHSEGLISRREKLEIETIVQNSSVADFVPLLFIIPFGVVRRVVKPAPVLSRARSSSQEYIVDPLLRHQFDVLELDDGRI